MVRVKGERGGWRIRTRGVINTFVWRKRTDKRIVAMTEETHARQHFCAIGQEREQQAQPQKNDEHVVW